MNPNFGKMNMWMVWDNEQGLVIITDNYSEAVAEYEKCKESLKDYVIENGEFESSERVVLAKIKKDFYCYDTLSPVMKEDDEGNEVATKDTYWDWQEREYF